MVIFDLQPVMIDSNNLKSYLVLNLLILNKKNHYIWVIFNIHFFCICVQIQHIKSKITRVFASVFFNVSVGEINIKIYWRIRLLAQQNI